MSICLNCKGYNRCSELELLLENNLVEHECDGFMLDEIEEY